MFKSKRTHTLLPNIRIPKEEYLIVLLCRQNINPRRDTPNNIRWKAFLSTINWERFVRILCQNQLELLLHKNISQNQLFKNIPQQTQKQLIALYLTETRIARSKSDEFTRIIKKLNHLHIPYVLMKTFGYTIKLFHSAIPKLYSDLDILIQVKNFAHTRVLLEKEGYNLYLTHTEKAVQQQNFSDFYTPKGEEIFRKKEFEIELHTTVARTLSIDSRVLSDISLRSLTQEFYKDTQNTTYQKQNIRVFSPTSLFVTQFIHLFFQHNYQGIMRYCELAKIMTSFYDKINWSFVLILLEKYKLRSYFRWFLFLLNDIFPSTVPAILMKEFSIKNKHLNIVEFILYRFIKYQMFHPGDFEYSDKQKEIVWAVIDRRLIRYFLHPIRYFVTK